MAVVMVKQVEWLFETAGVIDERMDIGVESAPVAVEFVLVVQDCYSKTLNLNLLAVLVQVLMVQILGEAEKARSKEAAENLVVVEHQ